MFYRCELIAMVEPDIVPADQNIFAPKLLAFSLSLLARFPGTGG